MYIYIYHLHTDTHTHIYIHNGHVAKSDIDASNELIGNFGDIFYVHPPILQSMITQIDRFCGCKKGWIYMDGWMDGWMDGQTCGSLRLSTMVAAQGQNCWVSEILEADWTIFRDVSASNRCYPKPVVSHMNVGYNSCPFSRVIILV